MHYNRYKDYNRYNMTKITFTIPGEGELKIKTGQTIKINDPLYQQTITINKTINLANKLHIKPDKIFFALKKMVGDIINKGDMVAENKSLFLHRLYQSEYSGILKEISHHDGTITINVKTESDKGNYCRAYFQGEITHIDGREITIKVSHQLSFPLKSASQDFGGLVYFIRTHGFEKETIQDVDDKIIITDKLSDYQQSKFEALGAKGFITVAPLPKPTELPSALSKQTLIGDFTACIVDKKNNTIFLYQ